jgi:hypothetical protein
MATNNEALPPRTPRCVTIAVDFVQARDLPPFSAFRHIPVTAVAIPVAVADGPCHPIRSLAKKCFRMVGASSRQSWRLMSLETPYCARFGKQQDRSSFSRWLTRLCPMNTASSGG